VEGCGIRRTRNRSQYAGELAIDAVVAGVSLTQQHLEASQYIHIDLRLHRNPCRCYTYHIVTYYQYLDVAQRSLIPSG
jgi:hypothetical protein